MASPQAENGHVDIAHEIIEALARYRLNGQEWQCLLVVFRKTYGWKKVDDEISLSQFQRMTGLSRPGVVRSLRSLVSKSVLISTHLGTTHANKYRFNKNFETWAPSTKKRTSGNFKLVPKIDQDSTHFNKKLVPPTVHTKETTKETNKRKVFVQPTIEEVKLYCLERKNKVNPEKWIDHYKSNGWKVGKNPMKDWKAAIRTWEKNDYGSHSGSTQGSTQPKAEPGKYAKLKPGETVCTSDEL